MRNAVQRHQSSERPILRQISSLMYPKLQRRQIIMNVLHPSCARPPRWSPPVVWRRFEDGLASICVLTRRPLQTVRDCCCCWCCYGRVISRAPGLKLVVQTLLSSLRPIGNIVLICCTFFIIFGILGVQVNCFYHSVTSSFSHLSAGTAFASKRSF